MGAGLTSGLSAQRILAHCNGASWMATLQRCPSAALPRAAPWRSSLAPLPGLRARPGGHRRLARYAAEPGPFLTSWPVPMADVRPVFLPPPPPLGNGRGMMDEEGNQFVAYFLPVDDTMRKRKRDQDEEMDYAPEDVYVPWVRGREVLHPGASCQG